VLDRLLDLLLIAVLRAWFARPEAETPDRYRASGDPVVGHALRLMHHNPAHPWTVATLARETGPEQRVQAGTRDQPQQHRAAASAPHGGAGTTAERT
jgi:hypothetical protein